MAMETATQAQGLNRGSKKKGALSNSLCSALLQSLKRYGCLSGNSHIDSRFSASLVSMCEASSRLKPAQKVRFVRYAQFRIQQAVEGGPRESDWNLSLYRYNGPLVEEAIQTLCSMLKVAPLQSEFAAELKISLDFHNRRMRSQNGFATGEPCRKGEKGLRRQGLTPLSCRLEDEPLFRYLRAEIAERIPRGSDPKSQETARWGDWLVRMPGNVQLPGPNLRKKLKEYWEWFSIGVHFSMRLGDRRLPWNANVDDRFSAALASLVKVCAHLEPTQKMQFVSYVQFRIERDILKGLRDQDLARKRAHFDGDCARLQITTQRSNNSCQ
jgi:DNA-directed RNA polymerase specialized sigma subunit